MRHAAPKKLRDYIQSPAIQRKWSREVRARDGFQCAFEVKVGNRWIVCGSKGTVERGFYKGVFACHIIPRASSGVAAFSIINGITGCHHCHQIYDRNTLGKVCCQVRVPLRRYEAAFKAVSFACTYPPKRRQ